MSLTSQWQFSGDRHHVVRGTFTKVSLTGQWQFSGDRHHVGRGTFTKVSLTGQWHFFLFREWVTTENCYWPVNDNFCWDQMGGCAPLQNCHWPVNDSFCWDQMGGCAPLQKCHWPVNDNFFCYGNGLPQKIVIDWSMTALMQLSKNVIDWSITIFASIRNGLSQKIVIDWSMTIFWQPWSNWEWLKAENHSTLWTYHLWPYVIDHSQWQKLMDKAQKSVIDNGQWQKNCHWLKVIYIGIYHLGWNFLQIGRDMLWWW